MGSALLDAVDTDMGLEDGNLRLEALRLLVHDAGGHFAEHADTEKCPGMIASATLIMPGTCEGRALVVEVPRYRFPRDADKGAHVADSEKSPDRSNGCF